MPRYKLRTLLIVLAIGPPLLAMAWFALGQIEFWLALLGAVVALTINVAIFFAAAFAVVAAGIWVTTTVAERIIRLLDR